MIYAETHSVRGHVVVSALVNDGKANGAWRMSRIYDGYPELTAMSLFREYCDTNGIEIVKGLS